MELDYKQICLGMRQVAAQAASYIAEQRRSFSMQAVQTKEQRGNLVSYVDRAAESMVVEGLRKLLPSALFVTEENTVENEQDRMTDQSLTWIIDPLDGTTNFVHGMPPYAVSIALVEGRKRIVAGVVHEVTANESFYAWVGGGAYLNEQPIRVSEIQTLEDSLIITGLAYQTEHNTVSDFVRLFDYFNRSTHGARRLGSAATDLVYVAAGRAEGFYQANLSPWDVAAGALIVAEAGGRVSDFDGEDDYLFGRQIVAANAAVYLSLCHTIRTI